MFEILNADNVFIAKFESFDEAKREAQRARADLGEQFFIYETKQVWTTQTLDEAMATKPKPVPPVPNINGTSREALIKQWHDAYESVMNAMKTFQEASPHGRDFQTVPEEVYRQARHQHITWLTQLDDMRVAMEEIIIQLQG